MPILTRPQTAGIREGRLVRDAFIVDHVGRAEEKAARFELLVVHPEPYLKLAPIVRPPRACGYVGDRKVDEGRLVDRERRDRLDATLLLHREADGDGVRACARAERALEERARPIVAARAILVAKDDGDRLDNVAVNERIVIVIIGLVVGGLRARVAQQVPPPAGSQS